MRETRPSGSEGGGVVQPVLPTPICFICFAGDDELQSFFPPQHEWDRVGLRVAGSAEFAPFKLRGFYIE